MQTEKAVPLEPRARHADETRASLRGVATDDIAIRVDLSGVCLPSDITLFESPRDGRITRELDGKVGDFN